MLTFPVGQASLHPVKDLGHNVPCTSDPIYASNVSRIAFGAADRHLCSTQAASVSKRSCPCHQLDGLAKRGATHAMEPNDVAFHKAHPGHTDSFETQGRVTLCPSDRAVEVVWYNYRTQVFPLPNPSPTCSHQEPTCHHLDWPRLFCRE